MIHVPAFFFLQLASFVPSDGPFSVSKSRQQKTIGICALQTVAACKKDPMNDWFRALLNQHIKPMYHFTKAVSIASAVIRVFPNAARTQRGAASATMMTALVMMTAVSEKLIEPCSRVAGTSICGQ